MTCLVKNINLYRSVRELLESEGVEKFLSSCNSVEKGIKSIHSISNYDELIQKNGVFAIELTISN